MWFSRLIVEICEVITVCQFLLKEIMLLQITQKLLTKPMFEETFSSLGESEN